MVVISAWIWNETILAIQPEWLDGEGKLFRKSSLVVVQSLFEQFSSVDAVWTQILCIKVRNCFVNLGYKPEK